MTDFLSLGRYHAAILDLDGTLADTALEISQALNETLAKHLLPAVQDDFVRRTIGQGTENLVRMTCRHLGVDEDLVHGLHRDYLESYQRFNGQHACLFPGVLEGLRRMQDRSWRLACLTNKPQTLAEDLLRQQGILDVFNCVYGGDALPYKKPLPEPVWHACQALGVSAEHCLMIGDSANDAQAARSAGCDVVLMRYGYNHGDPIENVPALAYLNRLDDLFDLTLSV